MEDYLYPKDIFLPLSGKIKKVTNISDEEWKHIDIKALRMIRLYLGAIFSFNISKENNTKSLMDTLSKLYENPSTCNNTFLMKYLFDMPMDK